MLSSTYHALRSSNFIKLPSERTTNYFENKPGFQDGVNDQLLEVERIERKYVALLIDEMKVKGLVYNKMSGKW